MTLDEYEQLARHTLHTHENDLLLTAQASDVLWLAQQLRAYPARLERAASRLKELLDAKEAVWLPVGFDDKGQCSRCFTISTNAEIASGRARCSCIPSEWAA